MNNSEIREHLIIARDEYIRLIKSELLGPGSEFSVPDVQHELISSTPLSRYSVGILYPQGNFANQDSDETVPVNEEGSTSDSLDEVGKVDTIEFKLNEISGSAASSHVSRTYEYDETADENLDEEIGMSSQYMPSSMGITFLAKGNTIAISGNIEFAIYRNAVVSDCVVPYRPENLENYSVPPELSHIMSYDKETRCLRAITNIQAKNVQEIFKKNTIPENESHILKQVAFRFADYCRNGFVRVPHQAAFMLDFSLGDY
jgi:hypothetical protein